MISVNTSPFHVSMLRKFNTWYTVKDGKWSDPAVWMGNGKKRHLLPQPGDDVYIDHTVSCDSLTQNTIVNNIYISGTLTLNTTQVLIVNGDLQASGTVDQSTGNNNIILNGYNNYITNLTTGISGTITYNGLMSQNIMPITHGNLTTSNIGHKYLTSNTTVTGNLSVFNLECLTYNLTINGTTQIGNDNVGMFSKSGAGNLLFIGQFSFGENSTIDWSVGNPNVEFRGGFNFNSYTFNTGTGTFSFTTNNQSLRFGANLSGTWNSPILISGPITVTNISNSTINSFSIINGDNVASTFINQGSITLNNTTAPMATGVFDYKNTSTSTINYNMGVNYTLPYTNYANLILGGSGSVKTLSGNTTITNLTVNASLECSTFDLTVNGTTGLDQPNDGSALKKNGSGNLLFVGLVTGANGSIDFSGGNPTVEFRGGFNLSNWFIKTGTGQWKFTTNNQTINVSANNTGTWNSPILISGAITITNISKDPNITGNIFNGILNGDTTASTFVNNNFFAYANAQQPMQTGVLICNTAANTFIYALNGNQDITPGTYKTLTLSVGGAKKLLGNVSVINTYTLSPPATLNSNGFTLTNP